MKTCSLIRLKEYEQCTLPEDAFSEVLAMQVCERYPSYVQLEFPSLRTENKWKFRQLGWVGYLPLSPTFGFALEPKIPLGNVFGMLEYAYDLKVRTLPGIEKITSLKDFYEFLAHILAQRILTRQKMGLYCAYLPRNEESSFIRGRLELDRLICRPWAVRQLCSFEEHTADIEDNQILFWTLNLILRSGNCGPRVLPTVRRAYHSLAHSITIQPFDAASCVGRFYSRLNQDYEPLHGLCRFFLEQTAPASSAGDKSMLPFLIDMDLLFERFVAKWLASHCPAGFRVKSQESYKIGKESGLSFRIDLVLQDKETGRTVAVLDTKYKNHRIETGDLEQIVAYAVAKACGRGILIYPTPLEHQVCESIERIEVKSVVFDLAGDLEDAGQRFLEGLCLG